MELETKEEQNNKIRTITIVSGVLPLIVLILGILINYYSYVLYASMLLFSIYIFGFYRKDSKMNILFGISTLLFGIYKFILLWSEWHFISIGNLDILVYNIGLNIVGLIIAGIMFLIISAHYFFGWKFNLTAFPIIALAVQFPGLILGLFERNVQLNILFEILATLPFVLFILFCPLHHEKSKPVDIKKTEVKEKNGLVLIKSILRESFRIVTGSLILAFFIMLYIILSGQAKILLKSMNFMFLEMLLNCFLIFVNNVIYIGIIAVMNAKYKSIPLSKKRILDLVKKSYWSVLLIQIIQFTLIGITAIPPVIIYLTSENPLLKYLLAAILCIPGIIIYGKFFFATIIAILEEKNVKAIRNSFLITKQYYPVIFFISLLYGLFLGVALIFYKPIFQFFEGYPEIIKMIVDVSWKLFFGLFTWIYIPSIIVGFYNKVRPGYLIRK